MNNKGIIFALGTIFGATSGSIITYFIVNKKRDEELEEYAEHCDERIAKIRREIKEIEDKEPEPKVIHNDPEDDKINKNKGVKKYHHDNGLSSKYGENNVFGKKAAQKLITEIEEDEFMNEENGHKKETIDILLGDDSDIVAFWGYGTDNETFVDKKFNKELKDIIGEDYYDYDYLLNLSDDEESIGTLYIRNDNLMIDFEIIIHDLREDDR